MLYVSLIWQTIQVVCMNKNQYRKKHYIHIGSILPLIPVRFIKTADKEVDTKLLWLVSIIHTYRIKPVPGTNPAFIECDIPPGNERSLGCSFKLSKQVSNLVTLITARSRYAVFRMKGFSDNLESS